MYHGLTVNGYKFYFKNLIVRSSFSNLRVDESRILLVKMDLKNVNLIEFTFRGLNGRLF
jgi:hypothetical protein